MNEIKADEKKPEVSLKDWEQRKAFVNFGEEDVKRLNDLRPTIEKFIDEVVEDFYRHFLSFEEPKAFFTDEAILRSLKEFQKEYFLRLTQGEYGPEYLKNRLHICGVYKRIGLLPRWYMGMHSIYLQLICPRIMESFGTDIQQSHESVLSLLKIVTLDHELAMIMISESSQYDPLTGILNRYAFTERVNLEFIRAKRHVRSLLLVMLDVDYLEEVNEQYGPVAVDAALLIVTSVIIEQKRDNDIFGRLEGGKFIIAMPETSGVFAIDVGERLRHFIENSEIHCDGGPLKITVSVGVASLDLADPDLETFMKRADRLLDEAKNKGGNCTRSDVNL